LPGISGREFGGLYFSDGGSFPNRVFKREKVMNGDELIWEAILDVSTDSLQAAVRNGQERKAEKLRKVVSLLYDIPEDEK
jgi:hypothetical protein